MEWHSRFEAEISKAVAARSRANEGQARVCARRAAGIAAAEYLARRGLAARSVSAIDALQQLMQDASLPAEVRGLTEHLIQPVGLDFRLPPGIDLVAEARRLRELLLSD